MPQTDFKTVIEKLVTDQRFQERFVRDQEDALAGYNLLPAEKQAALSLAQIDLATAGAKRRSQRDSNRATVRDIGVVLLSLFLLGLLVVTAFATFQHLDSPPLTYTVGDSEQVIDTFDRARDLLIVFFPLFSAVVTFWLGTAVEGRHTEKREQEAEQARGEQEQAEKEVVYTRSQAELILTQIQDEIQQTFQGADRQFAVGGEPGTVDVNAFGGEESTAQAPAGPNVDRLLHLVEQGIERFR